VASTIIKPSLDVAAVGNAIVDVLAKATDSFLRDRGLAKGAMTLIGASEAETLYAHMGAATECSGGSAANTVVGLALLGGRAGFMGKVRNDQLGGIFRHDIQAVGVEFAARSCSSAAMASSGRARPTRPHVSSTIRHAPQWLAQTGGPTKRTSQRRGDSVDTDVAADEVTGDTLNGGTCSGGTRTLRPGDHTSSRPRSSMR